MATFEDIGTDASEADGYVVLFKIGDSWTGVLVVLANHPQSADLRKLTKAIENHDRLGLELMGYEVERREVSSNTYVYEIKFAVELSREDAIREFLEFAKQARVLTNPIVSDIRDFHP